MIEIKVTIEEQEDGSVTTHTKSVSMGTAKESVFGIAIIEGIKLAADHVAGGELKTLRSTRIFRKVGKE